MMEGSHRGTSHFYLGRSWIPALHFDNLKSFGVGAGTFWAIFLARILGFWGILGIGFIEFPELIASFRVIPGCPVIILDAP